MTSVKISPMIDSEDGGVGRVSAVLGEEVAPVSGEGVSKVSLDEVDGT